MTTNPITFNSDSRLLEVFKHFDHEDGDGKLSIEELKICFRCLDIHADDGEIERFFPIYQNSDSEEDNNFFQNLSKRKSFEIYSKVDDERSVNLLRKSHAKFLSAFRNSYEPNGLPWNDSKQNVIRAVKQDHNDHVIDLNHLPLASITDENYSNISKLRDLLFGLTGQAAVSFLAYSPTRHLYVIVAVNALAFLFLLVSFCLRSSKQKVAERITGAIGIVAAAAVFFLMMGMFFTGRNM